MARNVSEGKVATAYRCGDVVQDLRLGVIGSRRQELADQPHDQHGQENVHGREHPGKLHPEHFAFH